MINETFLIPRSSSVVEKQHFLIDFRRLTDFSFSFKRPTIANEFLILRTLLLSTPRTSETRHKCLLLVVSRHTITATKVIIKACIIHTCYHCVDARFWPNIQAPILPFIGVSASLSACLSKKDGHPYLELTSQ